jgi:hypothetical protein
MRLGVSFIAPRQIGAVGDQLGRQFLHSVEWCTGQSGAPPDNHCSCPVRDLLPYRAQPTVAPRGWLAHRTLSGAHRTVRCIQPTVGAGHVSRVDRADDRWPLAPLAHRTVRWILVVCLCHFPRSAGSPSANLAHRTMSGAPPDSPVCQVRADVSCSQPILFQIRFSFLCTISSTWTNMLVLKRPIH